MDLTHLLVIGAPRSGTTLLASMLGCHPDISMLIEEKGYDPAITRLVGTSVVGNKLTIPNQIELTKRCRIRDWLLRQLEIRRGELLSFLSIYDYVDLPNSKIIGIVRDGHDVVRSIMNRGEQTYSEALQRWTRAIDILERLMSDETVEFHLVEFESLVKSPRAQLSACTEFLGIGYHQRMMKGPEANPIYRNKAKLDPAKAHQALRQGVDFSLREAAREDYDRYRNLLRKSNSVCDTTGGLKDSLH